MCLLACRPRPSHQPLPPRWPSPQSSPPPPWRWGCRAQGCLRREGRGADEGPSGDQLEASHQDGQGSHSGDGVSFQVPGKRSCRRPSKKGRHAARAREGSLREGGDQAANEERNTHDGCTNAFDEKKLTPVLRRARLCRLCPCQCSRGTRGTSIVDGLEVLTEGQPDIRLRAAPNTSSHRILHIAAAWLLLVLGLQSVSTPLVAGRRDDA